MINRDYQRGFAMLIFVIITAVSLMFLMIRYAELQRRVGDIVRDIVGNEKSIQNSLVCVDYVSSILSRYNVLSDELFLEIKNFKTKDAICNINDFDYCHDGVCKYRAIVSGVFGDYKNTIYIEWKSEEYRIYVSKVNFINYLKLI